MSGVDVGDDALHRLPAEPANESSGRLGGNAPSPRRTDPAIRAISARQVHRRWLRRSAEPAWHEQVTTAGLTREHLRGRPGEPATRERLHQLWIAHADRLRREPGRAPTENMLREENRMLSKTRGRRAVLLTPGGLTADQAAEGAADRMAAPSPRPGSRPESTEGSPQ